MNYPRHFRRRHNFQLVACAIAIGASATTHHTCAFTTPTTPAQQSVLCSSLGRRHHLSIQSRRQIPTTCRSLVLYSSGEEIEENYESVQPKEDAQEDEEREIPSITMPASDRDVAASSSVDEQEKDTIKYVGPYLKQLFLLCRPVNFPIVALFHVLGVHQAATLWESTSESSSSLMLKLLKRPSMIMVLLSLLLVTSTSMITNDYYDARNGVDGENEHYHPLAKGEVPFSITKTFDSNLYAVLLLSSAFVPGQFSRLLVLGGAIITYLYTVHLKPKTWIKNLSCAALVAMSPVTSGLAAWHTLCQGGVGTAATSSTLPYHLIFKSQLTFLVVSLFSGIMSREILMDITDVEGDAKAGIATIPVKYGTKFAARVALVCSWIAAISACGASLTPIIRILSTIMTQCGVRKVVLSVVGSVMLLLRTYSVFVTDGNNVDLAEKAIKESLISVLLVLASFL